MVPANAKRRHPIVEERTRKLVAFAEESSLNRIEEGTDTSMGIITSSTSYQYVKEVFGDKYPVLKIGLINPLPEKKIKDFAEHKPEESPDDPRLVQVARIRKARHYLRVLGAPWFKAIMEPDQYQELLEKLKIIGKQ
jgi:hypothetical protein